MRRSHLTPFCTLALALAFASCGPKSVEPRLEQILGVTPAELDAKVRWEAPPRVGRVRVLTDHAYATAQPGWKRRFTDELDYASQYLTPVMGLALDAVEWKPWHRGSDASDARGGDAQAALAELIAADDGAGVDWVIGLINAAPAPADGGPPSLDALGAGVWLGKHVILRGYDDESEAALVARALRDLSPDDRQTLRDARRRHHQTVALLHALGHTLGAIHETEPAWLMCSRYGIGQAEMSDRDREIALRTIRYRFGTTADAERPTHDLEAEDAFARELFNLIDGDSWAGWETADRDAVLARLRERVAAANATALTPGIPDEVGAQLDMISKMIDERDADGARDELARLLEAYPNNAAVRLFECKARIAIDRGPSEAAATACERAAELAPGDPSALLLLGGAHGSTGDLAGAHAVLERAAARAGTAADGAAVWSAIAAIYQALSAITWAEAAATSAGTAGEAVLAWARGVRNRYGLAPGGTVKPEDEPRYLGAVRGLLDLVYASKFDEAHRQADLADKAWRDAPGVLAARCDLALRQKQLDLARKHCQRAVSAFPDDAWALYLLGILDSRDKKNGRAATHLETAIAADPDLGQAYRALGKLYARTKATAKLEALRAAYQTRFGQALPD